MTQMAQTIEQQRAAFALAEIENIRKKYGEDKPFRKEFRSYASALPAMIHMNGLGQAAAFCRAKGGTYGKLYHILCKWMIRPGQPFEREKDLLAGITSKDMYHYRVAQAEALALLEWVKKFSLAFMVIEEDEKPATGEEES